jgi:dolichol kinase
VSIIARIIIEIIFTILNTIATREEIPSIIDERDKLIGLKATRNGLYTFIAGFLIALGSLAMDNPPATMFIILLGAGVASTIVDDLSQVYFYRRGV